MSADVERMIAHGWKPAPPRSPRPFMSSYEDWVTHIFDLGEPFSPDPVTVAQLLAALQSLPANCTVEGELGDYLGPDAPLEVVFGEALNKALIQ